MKPGHRAKELYRQLRALPWSRLWEEEVSRFDQAPARERLERVAVIRAVGAAFPESGSPGQKDEVLRWLRGLLQDPEEKVRRYAMAALPKLGAGAAEESELLALLRQGTGEREAKFLGRALDKIGGEATLQAVASGALTAQTAQKVQASVARRQQPSSIDRNRAIPDWEHLRIHLRGRRGLEDLVRQEVEEQGRFRVVGTSPGLVAVTSPGPVSLAELYALRCFDTAGFVLGKARPSRKAGYVEELASAIASPLSQRILRALTGGPIRYRFEFVAKGHQRGVVRAVVNRAFGQCPWILNDAREAPWAIEVHPAGEWETVELRPRFSPDPRQAFRVGDVPAASHPPLAACMVRLAGRREDEVVWDPFCGSGLELIERGIFGGVRRMYGSDLSSEAIEIARRNFSAAPLGLAGVQFHCCDFRDFAQASGLAPETLTLIVTNPPLGRRVRIPDLPRLFEDLFAAAAELLAPGGRLVLTDPYPRESAHPLLALDYRQVVDMGGFTCRLERYRKLPGAGT